MEGSQQLPAIDLGEINPVIRLSAQDFLYSLARTPNPKRFDRRRQRLLEGKPRLARVKRVIRDASRSTTVGAGSSQHDQALIDALMGPHPPLDAEHCQRPLNHEPDGLTVGQTVRIAGPILLNTAIDGDREKANKVIEGNSIDADHLSKQLSITPAESPSLSGNQQYSGSSSMFVSANAIDEDEESNHTNSTSLVQGRPTTASLEFPISSDFRGTQSPSSSPEHDVTHGERDCIETPMLDEIEHVSSQSQQNLLQSPKKKLRRPDREQMRLKTYGNRNLPRHQEPARKIHVPRMLASDELDLVLDRVPSNPLYGSDGNATEYDDDPIQDDSSPPFKGSRQARNRHNAAKVVKMRKKLNEPEQNVFKPDAIELSKYRLPNSYGMSPITKKRLKMRMKCSDGFEGRESQPTGRTMPMRIPRRHPQAYRHTSARVAELTLRSCRDISENIEILQTLQGEPFQSDTVTMFDHEENGIMIDASSPFMHRVPEFLENGNKIHRPGGDLQLRNITKLLTPFKGGDVHTKETTAVATPPNTHIPKRRVTFSEDVRVKTVQTLTMVSAPIAIASPCDSDESEYGTTDDEDDRTSSESFDEDGSDEETEGDSDDHHGSEDGNSNIEMGGEGDEELQRCTASLEATFQSLGYTEESLKYLKQGEAQSSQQQGLTDKSVRWKSVYHDGTHQSVCSPYPSHAQSPTQRVKPLITREGRQRQEITGDEHWRPRWPVSTRRLYEVDDDIFDYPSSPIELSGCNDQSEAFHSASTRRFEVQSCDDHHPSRTQTTSEDMEDRQERKQSQASVELGDPNWSVPYGSKEEQSYSQAQNSDYPTGDSRRYVAEEYPTHLALVLDSFNNHSQRNLSVVRCKSMPSNHRFHYVDQQILEDQIVRSLEMSPPFEHRVSPLEDSLSNIKSKDLRALTSGVNIEARTTPVLGRIQPLPFKPPFLRG